MFNIDVVFETPKQYKIEIRNTLASYQSPPLLHLPLLVQKPGGSTAGEGGTVGGPREIS